MRFDVICTMDNGEERILPFEIKQSGDETVLTVKKEEIPETAAKIDVMSEEFSAKVGEEGYIVTSAAPNKGDLLCPFKTGEECEWVFRVPLLPLFGIKKKDFCAAAMVLSGDLEEAHVVSVEDGLWRVFARFEPEIPLYEDIVIKYRQLRGGDADYSGMARAYRGHLLENGIVRPLKDRLAASPELAHAMNTIYVRIRQAWKPVPSPVPEQTEATEPPMHVAVTFERASQLIDEMKAQGVKDADICLVGWNRKGHDGRYPQLFPVEPELGGEEGLKKLIAHAKEIGYSIDCHTNSTDAYRVADSFDESELILKRDGSFSINSEGWSAGNMYHLCGVPALERAKEDLPKVAELGFHGLHYIDVISVVWPRTCFNPEHPQTRRETADKWLEIMRTARGIFGGLASEGCYDFAMSEVDFGLYQSFNLMGKMPEIAERRVPLWSLVYHGIVMANPSSETVNYPVKTWKERLKCHEYGGRPAIYVHSKFVGGDRSNWMGDDDFLCGSDEEMHKSACMMRSACDDYEQVRHLQTEFMQKHEMIAPDVYRVAYSNGDVMAFNYSEADYDLDGTIVPAHDYRLIRA